MHEDVSDAWHLVTNNTVTVIVNSELLRHYSNKSNNDNTY